MDERIQQEDIRRVIADARTIAVLGAHIDPQKPAHFVPKYMHQQGYQILPVNPVYASQVLWGETVVGNLAELRQPVDIGDVFRLGEILPMHLQEILAMRPLPKLVWLQLGVRNDAVAKSLLAAGVGVVQDRCLLADHRDMRLGPVV